uniref:Uncharacterized protein n=1 Tax=Meloidogyne incognita TaxID=6306 RepID=A0A914MHA1_MELIC
MSNRKRSCLHDIRIQVYNIDVEDLFIFSTQVMKFEGFCPSSSKAVLSGIHRPNTVNLEPFPS